REVGARVGIVATQAKAEIVRREYAHRHEVENLETQLVEKDRQLDQAEKINTLRGILLHIPITDKTPIMLRAANLIELDILERHNKVDELYKRFLPFSELFGRRDLGVVATPQDLTRVKEYITATYISPKPTRPTFICDVHSGPKSWNKYVSFSDMTFLMRKYGMLDIAWNYEGTDWGEVHTSWAYGPEWKNIEMFNHFKEKENTERICIYNNKLSKHNQEYRQASTQVFPSESFNRLVDNVNRFFTEGFQDAH
ncbi:MAG: hypothetical protein IJ730_03290, partial [Alphaproteobacteria bacterium]|nr:hypothetical protein [Alphaproteobacteria bacterium]